MHDEEHYRDHPALRAIERLYLDHLASYATHQRKPMYLLGLVDAYRKVAQVLSPLPLTMPDPPKELLDA